MTKYSEGRTVEVKTMSKNGPISRAYENDVINRRAAIDAAIKGADSYYDDSIKEEINNVPPAEPYITHIIMETLAECGIYGEEATIKLIGTLKRIGRDDLIPPCAR